MTAYLDRIRGLADGQPSLRVRPRSRFEPASPDAEPPWGRPGPDGAALRAETGEAAAAGHAGARADAHWPAAGYPETGTGAARTRSGLRPGRSLASSDSRSAADSPGSFPAPPDARRSRAVPPPHVRPVPPDGPLGVSGRPWPAAADPAEADRAEAGAADARFARPAPAGDLAPGDEHRPGPGRPDPGLLDLASESTGSVPAPARSRPGWTGSAPGDRTGAGAVLPAAPGRRPGSAAQPGKRAESAEPGLAAARPRVTASAPRSEPAGPYLGRLSVPDGFAPAGPGRSGRPGDPDPAADDRAGASQPERPGPGGPPAAGKAQPDEVTVTIGRVEVRVGPPPAAPGPAAPSGGARPPRPQPSRLEDYLRARSARRIG
jgi:hypothetical protein